MTILVLKFGGSVLVSEASLHRAVSEIYRQVREARKVVAVVSAFKGETDRLLRLAGHYTQASSSPATPSLVATGEVRASSLLAMACERSGIATGYRSPQEIGLNGGGDHFNAHPVRVNADILMGDLKTYDCVVVPGYVAHNDAGEVVLLGRGGTDLTAVYLGAALDAANAGHGGAEVRLIKDVDAVYDADPAVIGDEAHPYAALSWAEARKVAFPLVNPRAMQMAETTGKDGAGLRVSVAGLGRAQETRLGGKTYLASARASQRPIRIAVMGAGGVGATFLERCIEWSERLEVVRILVRDPHKRHDHPLASRFTQDARNFVRPDVDVFVDIGTGVSPSLELLEGFLKAGVSVTSANKQAVAAAGERLRQAARGSGAHLTYSASVGGGAPVLETLIRAVKHGPIRAFSGVLNGTSNFVIDQVQSGKSFDAAMDEARRLGFAEPDSTADLDGTDVGAKLKLVRDIAFEGVRPAHVEVGAITAESLVIPEGMGLRYVARAVRDGDRLDVSMKLETLESEHFLVGARGEQNRASIEFESGEVWSVRGKGAGAWPTSESLLADVLEIGRRLNAEG